MGARMGEPPTDGYEQMADLYDRIGPYRDRPDVPFYVDEAVGAGGPVLELGSGTGRILLPSARAGATMTGLEASPSMLAVCREKVDAEAEEVRDRITLEAGDMRSLALGRSFRLVTIPFRAFQHLITVEDQLRCLAGVHRHLAPGGRLIVDVFNPSLEVLANRVLGEEFGTEPEFEAPDGRRVVRSHRVVAHRKVDQVNEVELIHDVTHPDGRRERLVHAFEMRYLFRYELEHLLVRTGFVVEEVCAGYDRSPFGSRDPSELVVVARRSD